MVICRFYYLGKEKQVNATTVQLYTSVVFVSCLDERREKERADDGTVGRR